MMRKARLLRRSELKSKARLKPSKGTVIPPHVRAYVYARDNMRCVGPIVGMPGACGGWLELDHVRASGGIGMKSPSTADNLLILCGLIHHPLKTREAKQWRPSLIAYLEIVEARSLPESIW